MRCVILAVVLLSVACRPPGYDRGGGDDVPAVDAAPPQVDAAPDAATTCAKEFRLDGHGGAATVWLTGDFASWATEPSAGAVELARDGDGVWLGTHTFDAGSYQYKFIVDGTTWIADPANPNQIDDGFGGKNSVYTCAP